jgi:hypothetical protein
MLLNMNPTPIPRPPHPFTGIITRSRRTKLVAQYQNDLRPAYIDASTIRLYDKISVLASH